MLRDLHIQNFALIDELNLTLYPGFSVLTGETGAGKSIIIDALSLLLGARASSDVIRTNCNFALVEGQFDPPSETLPLLTEWGFSSDDGLIISREIHDNGRNKCRINGKLATLGQLSQLGPYLVDILGQHDHQSIANQEKHIEFLDSFGDRNYEKLLQEVALNYQSFQQTRSRRKKLEQDERERQRKMDLLKFQIDEIERAQLAPDEEEKITQEHKRLANAEKLQTGVMQIYANLKDGEEFHPGLLDQLATLSSELASLARIDKSLSPMSEGFEGALVQLEEIGRDLRDIGESYENNPERLKEVEDRISLIHQLKRKYGETILEVLEFLAQCQTELSELANSDAQLAKLRQDENQYFQQFLRSSKELSQKRQALAKQLEGRVEQELAMLNMEKTRFVIDMDSSEQNANPTGLDRVEFLISPNVGEEVKPLARIASGGEMSRIMLALKSVLSQIDAVPTMIFDEVDTGVGGKTAQQIAGKLLTLSKHAQVLSITHLPVIASFSHNHYFIEKHEDNGRTKVTIQHLTKTERIKELARMMGGTEDEEYTFQHAKALLEKASTI